MATTDRNGITTPAASIPPGHSAEDWDALQKAQAAHNDRRALIDQRTLAPDRLAGIKSVYLRELFEAVSGEEADMERMREQDTTYLLHMLALTTSQIEQLAENLSDALDGLAEHIRHRCGEPDVCGTIGLCKLGANDVHSRLYDARTLFAGLSERVLLIVGLREGASA